jgi:hypothetical protein
MICRQELCRQEHGDTSVKSEVCVMSEEKGKQMYERAQQRYLTECGPDPPCKPRIYAFYEELM